MNYNEHMEKVTSRKLQSCKEKLWIEKSMRRSLAEKLDPQPPGWSK